LNQLKLGKYLLKTPIVCGAVIGKNSDEMRAAIARAIRQGADVIEIRFDALEDQKGWDRLIRKDIPIIFTNRSRKEGGFFRGSEEKRIDLILEAIQRGVSCVDMELSTPEKLRERVVSEAKRSGVSVLISCHDFSKTPSLDVMIDFVKKMADAGCDLAKVVTFAKSSADALRIIDFLVQVQDEVTVPVIAFAMGDAGTITRITAPIFGSPLTYANAGKPTAPGQLDVAETKKLLQKLMPKER